MNTRTVIHGISYILVVVVSLLAIDQQIEVVKSKRQQAIPSFTQEYLGKGIPVETFEVKKKNIVLKKKITVRPDGQRGLYCLARQGYYEAH